MNLGDWKQLGSLTFRSLCQKYLFQMGCNILAFPLIQTMQLKMGNIMEAILR